jgi:ADP-ribosylation factor-binding protein GGA
MEAASARMAARDRYGAFGEAPASPLHRFICTTKVDLWKKQLLIVSNIVQACDPQNFEPNLALNLEITDLINSKKGSA